MDGCKVKMRGWAEDGRDRREKDIGICGSGTGLMAHISGEIEENFKVWMEENCILSI